MKVIFINDKYINYYIIIINIKFKKSSVFLYFTAITKYLAY